jgi:hypothetical protein
VVALAGIHIATSQFVPAPTDLISKEGHAGVNVRYKQVPAGICELNPDVKSYSGYADVEENQHIFWWFFEARNQDPTNAPLTVWINGGPGSSSMIGLFQENGPCGVDINGKVYDNPYSWSNASNMLFIDQPTQVGFSYSIPVPGYVDATQGQLVLLPNNTCPQYAAGQGCGTYSNPDQTLTANSTPAAAPNFYKTLQGFMGAFPDYSREEFFFATESYGGHYGKPGDIPSQNARIGLMHIRTNFQRIHSRAKRARTSGDKEHQPRRSSNRQRVVRSLNPVWSLLQLHRLSREQLRLRTLQPYHCNLHVQRYVGRWQMLRYDCPMQQRRS